MHKNDQECTLRLHPTPTKQKIKLGNGPGSAPPSSPAVRELSWDKGCNSWESVKSWGVLPTVESNEMIKTSLSVLLHKGFIMCPCHGEIHGNSMNFSLQISLQNRDLKGQTKIVYRTEEFGISQSRHWTSWPWSLR